MNFKKQVVKAIAVLMALVLSTAIFAGCGGENGQTEQENGDSGVDTVPQAVSEVINVAALNGPTGMGMVKLMDMTDKYAVTTYQSPTDAVAKLISGDVDVAALPSNMASVLYNKTEGKVRAVSPIALGVLHILGNNAEVNEVEELKGKTVIASGQGGTPEYVLQKVLESAGLKIYEDVNVKWLANHADVNTELMSKEGIVAMLPEPFVSAALAQRNDSVTKLFDMNSLWTEATGQQLPMGVLICRADFAENRGDDLKVLLADLRGSVDFVNESIDEAAKLIVEKGFMGNEAVAKAAIPNCHIVLFDGEEVAEGMEMLETLNKTLFEMDPKTVGGKLPKEDLYYGAIK